MTTFLSEICKVTLHFTEGTPSEFLVPQDQVEHFVEASKKLHHSPGINPHTGKPTAKIFMIKVATLGKCGPFWWSTPDLGKNYDPAGAHIVDIVSDRVAWQDDAHIARLRAEEDAMEAAI